jgi:hypothetical protein
LGFFSLYTMEKLIHRSWFSLVRPAFPYVERWLLRTAGVRVQENPGLVHELPLRDENIGVWCTISARRENSSSSGQGFRMVRCSTGILSAFGQEGNIFSICCSTGEFWLCFLMVIITMNLLLASFTDCRTFRDLANGVTLADRRAAAYRASRKNWPYITEYINRAFTFGFISGVLNLQVT